VGKEEQDVKPIVGWPTPEFAARGLKAGEVVIFTTGSYSDYMISRVVAVVSDLSAEEMEAVAATVPISQDNPNRPDLAYRYYGHWIDELVRLGRLKTIRCLELHESDADWGKSPRGFAFHVEEFDA
jgi:hypothetical protein